MQLPHTVISNSEKLTHPNAHTHTHTVPLQSFFQNLSAFLPQCRLGFYAAMQIIFGTIWHLWVRTVGVSLRCKGWGFQSWEPSFGLSALYVLANTWPCPPARLHSIAVHKACLYMVIVIVSSILNEDPLALPPLFISRFIIYLWLDPSYIDMFSLTPRFWAQDIN